MPEDILQGEEYQLDTFSVSIREQEDVENVKETAQKNLQRIFKGEYGHKIVRAVTSFGAKKTFLFNAGFEKELYNEIIEWIDELSKTHRYPIQITFFNFLSFGRLKNVNKE